MANGPSPETMTFRYYIFKSFIMENISWSFQEPVSRKTSLGSFGNQSRFSLPYSTLSSLAVGFSKNFFPDV